MRCQVCDCYRVKLHKCAVCGLRLCGCCSLKSKINGKRVCCYAGDKDCVLVNKQRAKEAADAL